MARHWLDLARYAESNGYERDGAKPNAWRYRDYVIEAFNEDKPYNRFIRSRSRATNSRRSGYLASIPPKLWNRSFVATGFYRLHIGTMNRTAPSRRNTTIWTTSW